MQALTVNDEKSASTEVRRAGSYMMVMVKTIAPYIIKAIADRKLENSLPLWLVLWILAMI